MQTKFKKIFKNSYFSTIMYYKDLTFLICGQYLHVLFRMNINRIEIVIQLYVTLCHIRNALFLIINTTKY